LSALSKTSKKKRLELAFNLIELLLLNPRALRHFDADQKTNIAQPQLC